MFVEPKLLPGSDQKVSGQVQGQAVSCHGCCTTGPEAQPSPCMVMKGNELRPAALLPHTPLGRTACSQETPTGRRVRDEGESQRRPVMGRIEDALVPPTTSLHCQGPPAGR